MTEADWQDCSDPYPMLQVLDGRVSNRKKRLFAVACCWRLLRTVRLHPWFAHGVSVAERFADGRATGHELGRVHSYPPADWSREHASGFDWAAAKADGQHDRNTKLAINACWNAMESEGGFVMADGASTNAAWALTVPGTIMPDDGGVTAGRLAAEQAVQADILRDIVPNPFRPIAFNPRWRTEDTIGLASGIYEDCAFDRLPLLADALQDAGCDDEVVLSHCRSEGLHVRGCHVVDLVLGKE